MAHYNVYSDLGIDPSLDSTEIVGILDQRIAATDPGDSAELDRLRTARQLFASESNRRNYDRALGDEGAPTINISRFRDFARGGQETASSSTRVTASTYSWDDVAPGHAQSQAATPAPAWASTPADQSNPQPSFDLRTLAVAPGRERSESLMWLTGFGIILLGWLYLPISAFSASRKATVSEDYFAGFDMMGEIAGTVGFVLLHTIAMLVLLQFLWNFRMYLGRGMR